jgi:hypothetical protein
VAALRQANLLSKEPYQLSTKIHTFHINTEIKTGQKGLILQKKKTAEQAYQKIRLNVIL